MQRLLVRGLVIQGNTRYAISVHFVASILLSGAWRLWKGRRLAQAPRAESSAPGPRPVARTPSWLQTQVGNKRVQESWEDWVTKTQDLSRDLHQPTLLGLTYRSKHTSQYK